MLTVVILLAVSFLLVLAASIIFTNGVEILGCGLKLHQGAVGSILAAVGTALPETVIPIIAIVFYGDAEAHSVGIGAIAGAPFMLATLGFFMTGAAAIVCTWTGRRSTDIRLSGRNLDRDLTYFIGVYGIAVLTTFLNSHTAIRTTIAIMLLAMYALYVRATLKSDGEEVEMPHDLLLGRLFKLNSPALPWIIAQIILSLGLMVLGAHMFVNSVKEVAAVLGIAPLVLSILITPVATELPEKLNSVLWIRRKQDVLALGNITGAMVFQSCFPVAFGMIFTPWMLRGATILSAVIALAMAGFILVWVKLKRRLSAFPLLAGGLMYLLFILYIIFNGLGQ